MHRFLYRSTNDFCANRRCILGPGRQLLKHASVAPIRVLDESHGVVHQQICGDTNIVVFERAWIKFPAFSDLREAELRTIEHIEAFCNASCIQHSLSYWTLVAQCHSARQSHVSVRRVPTRPETPSWFVSPNDCEAHGLSATAQLPVHKIVVLLSVSQFLSKLRDYISYDTKYSFSIQLTKFSSQLRHAFCARRQQDSQSIYSIVVRRAQIEWRPNLARKRELLCAVL
ncbi:hypothetical protein CA85_47580 [Allorhodopirellula solitaria]|uniref:Uncharacterized protein n=1 Tax=Allorhodopirellula solitaria TaxID=2527987 RepID=A0A5C5WZ84_9BACT|nr:hypothetical protein CA85_47580 [Allorhodopirellula solitaria]